MYLAKVAGNVGSNDALAAVVKLTHLNDRLRWEFVQSLAQFPQPLATNELEKLLTDEDSNVRSETVNALAERGDTVVIPVLLKQIENGSDSRADDVQALSHFPHDPRAVAAIQAAQKDTDEVVRESANQAWTKVKSARSKRAEPAPPK
jgi:HEAT repeat protein